MKGKGINVIRFNTEVIKKNEKILRSMIDRDDLYSSNFYLNFEQGTIQFKSGITKDGQEFHGHLKVGFDVEKEHENFNVDAFTFLHICSTYDNLIIKNSVFYNGAEKIKLKILDEISHNEPVSFEEFSWDNSKPISFSSLSYLEKAAKFLGERYPAVNIDSLNGKTLVAASDTGIYYEAGLEDGFNKLQLSDRIVKIFSDSANQEIRYNSNERNFYINLGDSLELITDLPMFSELPFVTPGFRERFTVPALVSFEKKPLITILKFFKPFFADVFQKIVQVRFEAGKVILKPLLEDYEVSKSIVTEVPSSIEGKEFNLSLDYFEMMVSSLEDDTIIFSAFEDFGENTKDFCIFSSKENATEKILCKFIQL